MHRFDVYVDTLRSAGGGNTLVVQPAELGSAAFGARKWTQGLW